MKPPSHPRRGLRRLVVLLPRSATLAVLLAGTLTACGPAAPKISLPDAAEKGDLHSVQKHIAAHSKLDARDPKGWTALHHAAARGDLSIVKALAGAGADVSLAGPGGKTALDLAREKGRIPVAKFLMDRPQARSGGGRGLVDGGLGVSSVLDSQ